LTKMILTKMVKLTKTMTKAAQYSHEKERAKIVKILRIGWADREVKF